MCWSRGLGLEGREVILGRTPLLGAGIRVRVLRNEADAPAEPEMLELSDDRRANWLPLWMATNACQLRPRHGFWGSWKR